MTNLEKLNKILNVDYIVHSVDDICYKIEKVEMGYELYEQETDGTEELKLLDQTIYHRLEEVISDLIEWDNIRDQYKKELATIMIEELTGHKWNEKHQLFKDSDSFTNLEVGNKISFYGFEGEYNGASPEDIPLDWLPYLHLAGNIFKESV